MRKSSILGSLFLEQPPDGGTKFVKIDGLPKLKLNGADQSLAAQPWASKWSLLRQAAESGNRSTVETIMTKLAVHIKTSWRLQPLHLMSESGNLGGIRKLLKYGADPLSYNKNGMNGLHVAAENGRRDVMNLLLQHRYEGDLSIDQILNIPSAQTPKWTVLHYAAAENQEEVLSLLLDQENIHKNAIDADGNTPLMIACEKRSDNAVKVLLQNCADVSIRNLHGKNCLSIAASKGYDEVVKELLVPDVNSRYREEVSRRGFEEGSVEHDFVNSRDAKDAGEIWTALHHAAAHNHEKVLRLLLSDSCTNVDARDSMGRSPLIVASERGHALAISILLRFSADISLRDNAQRTCLHAAASMGHTRVLAILLTIENLDIDAQDCGKNTALILACEYGHTEAVKQILQRKSAMGLVKQQSAAATGKTIRKLQRSTDSPSPFVNSQMGNKDGWKSLHMAASKGRVDVITVLLAYQDLVDIDSQDGDGNTALMLAAKHGETEAFKFILQRGANVLLCNADGWNCLHVAAEEGCSEVLKLLLVDQDEDELWGVELLGESVMNPSRIADSAQVDRSKKIYTGDSLAWNIVRLQLMEKESHEQFTPLHLAGRGHHIEIASLLLKAYLILALKVRGFTRHPRDPHMMPEFVNLVRDLVSCRYDISANSSDNQSSDSDGSRQREDISGKIRWINANEDFVIRNRLISFCTTYKHVDNQFQPSEYFSVNKKVFGESEDENLLVSTFVDAYMDFISYCNAGDKDLRTFLHHIAKADFRSHGQTSCKESMIRLFRCSAIDVNAVDSKRKTPLHLATKTGNVCVVRHILLSGRTAHLTAENASRKTPCSIAFANWKSVFEPGPSQHKDKADDYKTILTLLENAVIEKIGEGSDVHLVFQDAAKLFLRLLFEHLESSDISKAPDARKLRVSNVKRHRATLGGLTLLHYVAYRGLGGELKLLLKNSEYQSKVNITCSFANQTPLHFAVDKGHKEVVDILLKDDSEQGEVHMWSVRTTDDDAFNETPLEKAVKYKQKAAQHCADQEFNLYKDIEQMLMNRKDVKEYIDKLYRDRQVYVDASNAILVGAALIASVTFAGWLQPPLGYVEYTQYPISDPQGTGAPTGYQSFVAVQQHPSVRAFWILNSLSFFFAVATVVCGAGAVLQMQSSRPSSTSVDVKKEVRRMRVWLMVTSTLMAVAIMCVLGAFGAAGYAVLPPDIKYRADMFVTVSVGVSLCVVCLYCFFLYSGIVKEALEWCFGAQRRRPKLPQLFTQSQRLDLGQR